MEAIQKKIYELRSAIGTFVSTYPNDRKPQVFNISTMSPICDELEKVLIEYLNSSDQLAVKKCHSKIRAKAAMLKNHVMDSIKACGSDERLIGKYKDNQEYLMKKVQELCGMIPKSPRQVEKVIQCTLDEFEENNEQSSSSTVHMDAVNTERIFIKKISEMHTSVVGFVNSYPIEEQRCSVVGYINDINIYLKLLEQLYNRYKTCAGNIQQIRNIYNIMQIEMKNIASYYEMSVMIADANGKMEQYSENLSYVKRKIEELLESFKDIKKTF